MNKNEPDSLQAQKPISYVCKVSLAPASTAPHLFPMTWWFAGIAGGIILLYVIWTFNRLVGLKNRAKAAFERSGQTQRNREKRYIHKEYYEQSSSRGLIMYLPTLSASLYVAVLILIL